MTPSERKEDQIISYLTLRTLIGGLGILLPFLLVITDSLSQSTLRMEDSISDYYDNSTAGDLLVGVLFVLGFFLLSYKGYEPIDSHAANFGFACALGVALFPTTSKHHWVQVVHLISAFLLFATFIFFSLYLFRKTKRSGHVTQKKVYRNRVYVTCGIIMILCILGIFLSFQKPFKETGAQYNLVFWFETIALIAFGFSWIVKGELLWRDNQPKPEEDDTK